MNDILRMDGEGPFDDLEGNAAFERLFNKYLAKAALSEVLANNSYLKSANAAGNGFLDLLKADASNNTIINALLAKKTSLTVNGAEIAKVDANGLTSSAFLLADGDDKNTNSGGSATGLTANLTNSSAAIDGGNTLTLGNKGTYLIIASVNLQYVGATFAANRNVALKLRRTNNTPSDLSGSDITIGSGIVTTVSGNFAALVLPPVTYSTENTNDVISIFGSVAVAPEAGNLANKAVSYNAIRLYR